MDNIHTKDNKKVSVVIPNYNKRDYLYQCVKSVLKQTYDNIEIIIVDDCSTDDSRKIIEEISEKNDKIVPVFVPVNGGVCKARNIGAKVASGYYITFLDSDDVYINDKKIQNEINIIKYDNDIAFSQWVPLDVNGTITSNEKSNKNIYGNRYGVCKILSTQMPGYQQLRGYMFTKKLFFEVGGYTFPHNFYEDFDFQCRLALNGKLNYTKEYGEGYRNVPGGLSKQKILNSTDIIKLIQNKYYQELHIDQKLFFRWIMVRKRITRGMLTVCSIFKRVLSKAIN